MRIFILILVIIILIVPIHSALSQESEEETSQEQEFEMVEDVVDVTEEETDLGFLEIIGRMHPATVHFPIGWLFLLFLTELIAVIYDKPGWHKAGFYILIMVVLSLVAAAVTGLINASYHQFEGEEQSLMITHRNLNYVVTGLCLLALGIRVAQRRLAGYLHAVYLTFVIAAAIIVLISGHLGSKMVFGLKYLPF